MDNNNTTFAERSKGGHVFVGGDMDIIRAGELWKALKGYAALKMLPTRGVRASDLLKLATQYTGKKYTGKDKYLNAAEGVWNHMQVLMANPRTDKSLPRFPA